VWINGSSFQSCKQFVRSTSTSSEYSLAESGTLGVEDFAVRRKTWILIFALANLAGARISASSDVTSDKGGASGVRQSSESWVCPYGDFYDSSRLLPMPPSRPRPAYREKSTPILGLFQTGAKSRSTSRTTHRGRRGS
jgi:hypothetical protein